MKGDQQNAQRDLNAFCVRMHCGCGNGACANAFCASSKNFVMRDDIEKAAAQLADVHAPICTLHCTLERFLALEGQTDACKSDLLRELFTSPQAMAESFTVEGRFSARCAGAIPDHVLKFLPQYTGALQDAYTEILERAKTETLPMEVIVTTLCSAVFAEDMRYGEFCSLVLRGPFIARFHLFVSKMAQEDFKFLLGEMQQHISLRSILNHNVQNDDGVLFGVLKVVNAMYQVNEDRKLVGEEKFYNEVLAVRRQFPTDIQRFYADKTNTLLAMPFIIPLEVKRRFLKTEAQQEMDISAVQAMTQDLARGAQVTNTELVIEVHRDNILVDSLNQLMQASPADLKKRLHVKFVGEEGLDHGGVSKEWFQLVTREIFKPDNSMFVYNEKTRVCWFNLASNALNDFKLIGTLFGLAIYNGVILDAKLPQVAYKKLLGRSVQMTDLEEVNPDMMHSLQYILDYKNDDIEETMGLVFQHTDEVDGHARDVDLKPNGGSIPVTQENKGEFVSLMTDYILNVSVAKQFESFLTGFKMVFDSKLLGIFSAHELELLIAGSDVFDFHELEYATRYANGYTRDTPVVRWLWEIVHAYPIAMKKQFLFFATGSDRCPPGGLGKLSFIVAKHGDPSHLPTASTCNNLFLLPPYESKEELEQKLTFALNNTKGFGLI